MVGVLKQQRLQELLTHPDKEGGDYENEVMDTWCGFSTDAKSGDEVKVEFTFRAQKNRRWSMIDECSSVFSTL